MKTAIAHLPGEKNGSAPGMRLNFAVKNAKLNQKKVLQMLELDPFTTILISIWLERRPVTAEVASSSLVRIAI